MEQKATSGTAEHKRIWTKVRLTAAPIAQQFATGKNGAIEKGIPEPVAGPSVFSETEHPK